MSEKMGFEGKLYYNTGASYESPTWTEIKNVKDLTLSLEKGEADATTRAAGGWRATKGALKDAAIEFQMVWDPADTEFAALHQAYLDGSQVDLAIMDGVMTDASSEGLRAVCEVLKFTRGENLEEVMTAEVSLKPTYSANPPAWISGGP